MALIAEKEKQEYEILLALDGQSAPLGSGVLRQLLMDKGLNLSEATVGRMLSEMDKEKLTSKVSYKGRILTNQGREKLEHLKSRFNREHYGARLMESLALRKKEDLIDVLVARRAIERELARLAAQSATKAQIAQMEYVIWEQKQYAEQHRVSAEHDTHFHDLIAEAANNNVLRAAMKLIRHDVQLSPTLELIRTRVGGSLVVGHSKILAAIQAHDPNRAEQAMIEHIESLIEDVQKYWTK